jgi:hypothetical protein
MQMVQNYTRIDMEIKHKCLQSVWFRFIVKRRMTDEHIRELGLTEKNPDHIRVQLKEVEYFLLLYVL